MTAALALLKVFGPALLVRLARLLPDLLDRWIAGAPAREERRRRRADDALRGALAAGDVGAVEDAFSALGV